MITNYSARKKRLLLSAIIFIFILLMSMSFLKTGDETGSPFHSVVGAVVLIMGTVYMIISSRGNYLKGVVDEIRLQDIVHADFLTEGFSNYIVVQFFTKYEEHEEIKLKREFGQFDILLNILDIQLHGKNS